MNVLGFWFTRLLIVVGATALCLQAPYGRLLVVVPVGWFVGLVAARYFAAPPLMTLWKRSAFGVLAVIVCDVVLAYPVGWIAPPLAAEVFGVVAPFALAGYLCHRFQR